MMLDSFLITSLLLLGFLVTCESQISSVPDECPYAAEVQSLPVECAGLWRDNRVRLVSLAFSSLGDSALIVLTGDNDVSRYPFRQNSNFYYLTGANMPAYYVSLYVTSTNPLPFTTLFVPAPTADYAVWNGRVYSKEQLQIMFDVDEVLYTNETTNYTNRFPVTTNVFTIVSSVAVPTAFSRFTINRTALGSFMTNSRATKSTKEIILMTLVNKISSYAHLSAMQFIASRLNDTTVANGKKSMQQFVAKGFKAMLMGNRAQPAVGSGSFVPHVPLDDVARKALEELSVNFTWTAPPYDPPHSAAANPLYEYEVESEFIFQCGLCGALQQSYLPIVGSGDNGAILHYIANNQEITSGEMLLIDAGTEYWGYGSDITRTYPVNGVFTAAQTLIYNIVLQAQADVVAVVKAGASWNTLNAVARESITQNLLKAGLLQGDLTDLMRNSVYNIFYPHGIGHSVGLDVHDSQTPSLAANQVITVEPGVYFNSYLLDQAFASDRSKFIVWDVVNAYRGTGGVRIEDDYVVTADGSIQITVVPSSIEAIEKIMQLTQ